MGGSSAVPGCQVRTGRGVMVRRLSVASLDSGAESPVYGAAPSASADRDDTAAIPLRAMKLGVPRYPVNGARGGSSRPVWLSMPSAARAGVHQGISVPATALMIASQSPAISRARAISGARASGRRCGGPESSDRAPAGHGLGTGRAVQRRAVQCRSGRCRAVPCGATSLYRAPGAAARDTTAVRLMSSSQVRGGVPRLTTSWDMSVVDPQSGRWYVRDIRASTQPMGTQ